MARRLELLVFGVDGMDFELTRSLIDAGTLPHLGRFAAEVGLTRLRCTWPPHTATGWASFIAGALPGEHGIFQFWDCQNPDYEHVVTPRTAIGRPTLLDALAQAGRDIGMVNLPMSHPPSDWPGYEVTWPLVPTLRFFRPPEIFRELCGAGGHVRSDIMSMYDGSADYALRARDQIRARTRGMKHLVQERPTSVVGVVYTEVDRVSHPYWHELELETAAPGAVAEIYAEVDRAFGELLELARDDTTVLVVSDHGFGRCRRGLGVHRMLHEGGFCAIRTDVEAFEGRHADHEGVALLARSLDWSATRFYMPTAGCFGINVNLAGRNRHGIVPEDGARDAIAQVTEYLLGLRDPEDEGPLFSAVVPREIAYPGPHCEGAPDLLLVPRDPEILLLADPRAPRWGSAGQTGIHSIDGVCLLRTCRSRGSADTETLGIEALAGMLLDDLGIDAPAIPRHDADRIREATAWLPEGAWRARPGPGPRRDPAMPAPADRRALRADADLAERLRLLGYW
jgi:predicted AlkP superfamily phosphohydrolase/phosphomutase